MPVMWDYNANNGSGGWVDLDDDQALAAYNTGNYAFQKGEMISVRLPNGKFSQVDESNLETVLNTGGQYDTYASRKKRREENEYGGISGAAVSGLTGIAQGLLTDDIGQSLLTSVTALDDEEFELYQKYNPTSATIGKVGGFVAPFLLPGGGALKGTQLAAGAPALSAAKKAVQWTPSGMAGKAAVATEKWARTGIANRVGRTIGGRTGEVAATAATLALGGAAADGLYGGISILGEETLGDTDRTVGEMFTDLGMYAAMGGALGGVLGGLGASVMLGGKAISKMSKGTVFDMSEEAGTRFAKTLDEMEETGVASEVWEKGQGAVGKAFKNLDEELEALKSNYVGNQQEPGLVQQVFAKIDDAEFDFKQKWPQIVREKIDPELIGPQFNDSFNQVFDVDNALSTLLRDNEYEAAWPLFRKLKQYSWDSFKRMTKTAGGHFESYATGKLREMTKALGMKWKPSYSKMKYSEILKLDDFKNLFAGGKYTGPDIPSQGHYVEWGGIKTGDRIGASEEAVNAAKVYKDDLIRWLQDPQHVSVETRRDMGMAIQDEMSSLSRLIGDAAYSDSVVPRAATDLRGINTEVKKFLENKLTWGDELADIRGKFNNIRGEIIGKKYLVSRDWVDKDTFKAGTRERDVLFADDWQKREATGKVAASRYQASPEKVDKIIERLYKQKKDSTAANNWEALLKDGQAYTLMVDDLLGTSHHRANLFDAIKTNEKQIEKTINAMNEHKAYKKMFGDHKPKRVGGAWWYFGAKGLLTGMTINTLTDPIAKLKGRIAVRSMLDKGAKRIDDGIASSSKRILSGDTYKGGGRFGYRDWFKQLKRFSGIELVRRQQKRSRSENDAVQSYHIMSELANNQQYLTQMATDATASLDGVPKLQAAAQERIISTVMWTWRNSPKYGMTKAVDLITGDVKYSVSDSAARQWGKTLAVANDPVGYIVDAINRGTLSERDVRGFRELDMVTYQKFTSGVINQIMESSRVVPYRSKLMLSVLTGMPVSALLTPGSIAALQQLYAPKDEGAGPTPQPRMSALKEQAKSTQTIAQRVALP